MKSGGFAPIVLAGFTTAALTAVAANRPFVTGEGTGETAEFVTGSASAQAPLVFSLALVVLACWGVVLVSRTRVRRIVLVGGALAAAVATVAAVLARGTATDQLEQRYADVGATVATSTTPWFFVAVLAALLSALVCAYAAREVAAWPQMSSRYDTPTAAPATETPIDQSSSHDLWKSLDRGEDPT